MKNDIATLIIHLLLFKAGWDPDEPAIKVSKEDFFEWVKWYKLRHPKENCNYHVESINGWITTYKFDRGITLQFRKDYLDNVVEGETDLFMMVKRSRVCDKYERNDTITTFNTLTHGIEKIKIYYGG